MSTATPECWVETTFRDVTDYISRGKSPKYAEFSGLPVVNQKAIRWYGLQNEHLKFIHPDQVDQWTSERFIQEGDVLWNSTGTGTIGRACLVQKNHLTPPKVVDSHVTIVRPNKEIIDPRYLFAWIRSPEIQGAIADLSSGSTNQIELNRSTIAETRLPLAPLNEQKRIADKLDSLLARVDACRERLDRVPLILKRFRQAVLAAATSGVLTEDWRENAGIVCHDADGDSVSVPEDWRVHKIGDVFSLIDGDRGPNYPKQHDYLPAGHCLFLSTKNVRPFGFSFEETTYISEQKHKTLRNGTLEFGDIIITTRGTLGNVAVYDEKVPYSTVRINSGMLILRRRRGFEILNNYVKYYIASPLFFAQLNKKQSGSAQPQIPAGVLKTFAIPFPPTAEQHEIIRRVETLFAFADRLEARYTAGRTQVEQLTPSLLDKAFRGELVPQNPNDEPAEKLLERIKETKIGEPKSNQWASTKSIVQRKKIAMKTKTASNLAELVAVLDSLEGEAKPEHLIAESGLSGNVDLFFELLRDGRDQQILDVPIGSNAPIRRKANAHR